MIYLLIIQLVLFLEIYQSMVQARVGMGLLQVSQLQLTQLHSQVLSLGQPLSAVGVHILIQLRLLPVLQVIPGPFLPVQQDQAPQIQLMLLSVQIPEQFQLLLIIAQAVQVLQVTCWFR